MVANQLHDRGKYSKHIRNSYDSIAKTTQEVKSTSQLLGWQLSVRQEITHRGQNVEEREPLNTVGGNINWNSHYGKCYGNDSKNGK